MTSTAIQRARLTASEIGAIQDVRLDGPDAERLAGDLLRALETVSRDLDAARKAEKAPHLAAGREVDQRYSAASEPIDRVAAILRRRLSEAATLREQARRLAVETAAAAARAGDAAGANEAIVLANDPVFAPVVAEGLAERVTWEIESVDVRALPPEYLLANASALLAHARALPAGVDPQIPGAVFRRVVTHVVRRLP